MEANVQERQDFFVINQIEGGMGTYDASCDMLHPELRQESTHYAMTETHYFGFNVPEHNIDAICYLVYRPNLGVVQGGAQVFQGIKGDTLASELYDMRNYMSDDVISHDLQSFKLDSGYSFEVIEPGKKFRLMYNDPKRNNSFDIVATAASAPVVWPNGRHFEQTMHNKGELVLRGKRYEVDSYHVRDRSWEGSRLERPEPIPPITWMFGASGEDFTFQCTSIDHPELNPEWKDHFQVSPDDVLKGGWLWKDGQAALVKSTRNRVTRNKQTLFPEKIEVDIVDTLDRRFRITGTVTAAAPIYSYMHQRGILCQTRWETEDGQVMWGEVQEAQFTDFVQAMMP